MRRKFHTRDDPDSQTGCCIFRTFWLIHHHSVIMANYSTALPRRVVVLITNIVILKFVSPTMWTSRPTRPLTQKSAADANFETLSRPACFTWSRRAKFLYIQLLSFQTLQRYSADWHCESRTRGQIHGTAQYLTCGQGNQGVLWKLNFQPVSCQNLQTPWRGKEVPAAKGAAIAETLLLHFEKEISLAQPSLRSQTRYLLISMEISWYREKTPIIFWIDPLCVPVGGKNMTYRV